MTRNELRKLWCAAEGGKKSALDWPQSGEAYTKLRKIILRENGIDLDDVIQDKVTCTLYHGANVSVSFKWRASSQTETMTATAAKPARRGK